MCFRQPYTASGALCNIKAASFGVLLLVFSVYAHAEGVVSGSCDIFSGFLFGEAHEYVLQGDTVISRLDWDENGVPFIGVNGRLVFFNCFLNAAVLSAIPPLYAAGSMDDYDFLLPDSDDISYYSHHNAYLDKHYEMNLSLGYVFSVNNIEITPSTGYLFINRKWRAAGGFLQYPAAGQKWTGDEPKQNVEGTVITYEQILHLPFFSVGIAYKMQPLKIEAAGIVYPFIWCDTLDSHFVSAPRPAQFYDEMEGGIGGNVGVSFLYSLPLKSHRIDFKVAFDYNFIRSLEGSTASQAIGKTDDPMTNSVGYGSKMESDAWKLYFGVLLRFQ